MSDCKECQPESKNLLQCDECFERFCIDHLKEMNDGYRLCAGCVPDNAGHGS